jgi:hypothetical protein
MGGHIALLGDSIFDNAVYVDGPDVIAHLRGMLGEGWRASLLAVDGSVTTDIAAQLDGLPSDVTHLVISIGGNDILHHVGMLEQSVQTVGEAMALLAAAQAEFAGAYRAMLGSLHNRDVPTAVCTIYDTNPGEPLGLLVATALGIFNDVVTRNAFAAGLDLIDLRLVCTQAADYANPIEPSVQGGAKIAAAVARYATGTNSLSPVSRVSA